MKTILKSIMKRAVIWSILVIALFLPWRLRIRWAEKISKLNSKKGSEGALDRFLFK